MKIFGFDFWILSWLKHWRIYDLDLRQSSQAFTQAELINYHFSLIVGVKSLSVAS